MDRGLDDHDNIVLVALDGFAPDDSQLARPSTQVWAAWCGGVVSRNHNALKRRVGARLHLYLAADCKKEWPLHFSLVNSAANDKSVQNVRTGYAGCRANLSWF